MQYEAMFPTEQINVLLSFGRTDQNKYGFFVTHRTKVHSVTLDSGAYTLHCAARKPPDLTVELYREYALEHGKYVDFLFNLDSDFSENGHYETGINLYNQAFLEEVGLDPVPVIHDIYGSEISDYINRKKHKMLAIGSSLLGDPTGIQIAIHNIHRAGIMVHLFGTTSFKLLATNPVSSCDASTWHQAAARGYILFWNPNGRGKSHTDQIQFTKYSGPLPKERIPFLEYEFRNDLSEHLQKTFGFEPSDLRGASGPSNRQVVNIHYFVELQKRINAEHRKKGFFPNSGATLM